MNWGNLGLGHSAWGNFRILKNTLTKHKKCKWCYSIIYHGQRIGSDYCSVDCTQEYLDWKRVINYGKRLIYQREKYNLKKKGLPYTGRDKEKIKRRKKLYYQLHKEKIKIRMREYRKTHKDLQRAWSKKSYHKHKLEIKKRKLKI